MPLRKCNTAILVLFSLFITNNSMGSDHITLPEINNPATPSEGLEIWILAEQWRVGGESGEDIFGVIEQILVDDKNNIYLLDSQQSEVAVFTDEGKRAKTLSRQGDGPGETRSPTDMFFFDNGNIGLVSAFPGSITVVDREGTPVTKITPGADNESKGGFVQFADVKSHAGRLFICGDSVSRVETSATTANFIYSYDLTNNEKKTIVENKEEIDLRKIDTYEDTECSFSHGRWALGADGRVYVAEQRNEYLITVYNFDGTKDRIFGREYSHYNRINSYRQSIADQRQKQNEQSPLDITFHVSDTEPDIAEICLGPDGNIWVCPSRGRRDQKEGILGTWDVFNPDGKFIKQVTLKCPGNGIEDRVVFTGKKEVLVVSQFSAEQEGTSNESAPTSAILYSAVKGSLQEAP